MSRTSSAISEALASFVQALHQPVLDDKGLNVLWPQLGQSQLRRSETP